MPIPVHPLATTSAPVTSDPRLPGQGSVPAQLAHERTASALTLEAFNGSLNRPSPLGGTETKLPIRLHNNDGTVLSLAPGENQPDVVSLSLWNLRTQTFVHGEVNTRSGLFRGVSGAVRGLPIEADSSLEFIVSALRRSSLVPEKSVPLPRSLPDPTLARYPDPNRVNPEHYLYQQPIPVPKESCPERSCASVSPHEVAQALAHRPDFDPQRALNGETREPDNSDLDNLRLAGRLLQPPTEAQKILTQLESAVRGPNFNLLMVDSPYPHAESRENGFIVLTTGFANLLERRYPDPAKRVQAWATVLAHEMAHDLSDHGLRLRDFPSSLKSDRSAFVDQLAKAARQRQFELEADRVGNGIAISAGLNPLDPVELRDLLETMRAAGKSFPPGLDPVFLRYSGADPQSVARDYSASHPLPDTRRKALETGRK